MAVSKFLAVDLGAESGRVIVGILEDQKFSVKEIHRFPNEQIHKNNSSYWDVPFLFKEIKKGMLQAVQKGHGDIESMGVDTWGVDFGLIGKNGELLELPHSYRDNRTKGIPEKVFGAISSDEIYQRTGIQIMQINSLYQLYSVKLENETLLSKCDKLLFTPDLFNYFLTGKKKCEYTIASTSQMLNSETKTFDEFIFSKLELPINIMAPIIRPGTIVGKLRPEISHETMLKSIDIVGVGCHDTASAVAAVPASGEDWAFLSSGTWSLLGIETDGPIIELSLKNNFTNEGGVYGKMRFISNTMGLWFLQEIKKNWENSGEQYDYDEIMQMAKSAEEFICNINPDDPAFINPADMVEAIRDYCVRTNQEFPKTKGGLVRSILESLALRYKTILDKIEKISERKINKLHILGGGSQNGFLNQLTADATGKEVIAGPIEATALGNIIVQAIAKRKIESLEKAREIISSSFPQKFYKPENHEKWEETENRFNIISLQGKKCKES
jgi:rhamnulokinase